MKILMLGIAITIGSLVSFSSMACGSPDSTTHTGTLISIDKDGGQFTILDMMLGTPISFNADAEMLSGLDGIKGPIQVDFEDVGEQLKAVEVRR